ncbi:MAG TPA: 4-(cytidine 5'-diphospho)-2-C-methyl-D-erythritol kinase [Pyrinomonadaceae bacterium]|nr:4-(cytidine 5'-diphospho)-2-C-methyl-D-erythritol kinase [Pyrinomonadaceae bacterium]
MDLSLPSYAKINWTLRVLGRRNDGFHELFTVFQTVSLHDTLRFEQSDELRLTCNDPGIPADDSNLILKAARVLQSATGHGAGARIHLEKRIPSPGGLGGGSSNAAVALIGLWRLWELRLDMNDLGTLAVDLGSDVPFFLTGGTAVGTGRGEVIEPTTDIRESNVLVVTPDVRVSTPEAFAGLGAPVLTKEDLNRNLTVCRNEANSSELLHQALKNDLEPSVFARFPEIERVKRTLLELGAVNAAMSGSGASVFAIFDKQETRQAAINALASERDWRKFAVSTVSRSEYRDALGI